MATDEGQQPARGISRRSVLRGGLLAGAGVATLGAASAFFTGTAEAATQGWQFGWGYCIYCHAMFFTQTTVFGPCPWVNAPGGTHNVRTGNYVYELWHDQSGLVNYSNPQPNWRWCHLCECLFWGGNTGHCWGNDYGYYPHQISTSYDYDNYWDTSGIGGQQYWRWCKNCSELYYQGPSGSSAGVCPLPAAQYSPHQAGSGTSYTMWASGVTF